MPRKIPQTDPYSRPPHNIEAEVALLGAVLVNNQAYDLASLHVRAEDFWDPLNARIWRAIETLRQDFRPVTPFNLRPIIDPAGDSVLGEVTVSEYLARLVAEATPIVNAEDYADQIRSVTVAPGETGSFEVFLNRKKLFSKQALDRFPEPNEVEGKLEPLLGA